jgi:hypothetical protein
MCAMLNLVQNAISAQQTLKTVIPSHSRDTDLIEWRLFICLPLWLSLNAYDSNVLSVIVRNLHHKAPCRLHTFTHMHLSHKRLRHQCSQDFQAVDPRFEYFEGALNRPYISDQMFGLKSCAWSFVAGGTSKILYYQPKSPWSIFFVFYPNWQISILGSIFLLFLHIGNSL